MSALRNELHGASRKDQGRLWVENDRSAKGSFAAMSGDIVSGSSKPFWDIGTGAVNISSGF